MAQDAWAERDFAREWDAANAVRDNPDRANQLDLLITLLEGAAPERGWMLDLGAGSGQVEALLFERVPHARVACLDSSEEMLHLAAQRLRAYPGRYLPVRGDLNDLGSVAFPHAPYAAVFSSQALHEITHEKKRAVFGKVFDILRPGGAFYVLDRVETRLGDLPEAYERVWNRLNRGVDAPHAFAAYRAAYEAKDDHPPRLADLLAWLSEAGFVAAPLYLHFNRALVAARKA